MNEPIRLLLGERASAHLAASGGDAFLVIGRASYPDDPSRWILHLAPCPMDRGRPHMEQAEGLSLALHRTSYEPRLSVANSRSSAMWWVTLR